MSICPQPPRTGYAAGGMSLPGHTGRLSCCSVFRSVTVMFSFVINKTYFTNQKKEKKKEKVSIDLLRLKLEPFVLHKINLLHSQNEAPT